MLFEEIKELQVQEAGNPPLSDAGNVTKGPENIWSSLWHLHLQSSFSNHRSPRQCGEGQGAVSVQSCLKKQAAMLVQKGDSQYLCAMVTPRLICSYVTNITTFHDPSRRKEGMNLNETKIISGV